MVHARTVVPFVNSLRCHFPNGDVEADACILSKKVEDRRWGGGMRIFPLMAKTRLKQQVIFSVYICKNTS